jgi:oligopeptide transport system substrate-binding protein
VDIVMLVPGIARRLGVVTGGILLALGGSACARQPAPAAQPDPPAPADGGTFHVSLESIDTLDPAFTQDAYAATVVNQLFSGLLRADGDLNVLPDLAQSWRISRDGTEYVFRLTENARFHHGRRITSDDFVYSFTRLFDRKQVSPGIIQDYLGIVDGVHEYQSGAADSIRGLSAPDPRTLIIRLSRPYPSFLSVLCMDQAKVVPRDVIETLGPEGFGRHPVGSGPFRLARWDENGDIVLVRNAAFYGHPAYLDSLVFLTYPGDDGQREKADFLSGKLQAMLFRQREIPELLRKGPFTVARRLELTMEFVGFNAQLPPFNDVRVRRALSMAIDRQAMQEAAGPGFMTPAGILPPGMPGYTPEPKIIPEDPQGARELLAEAGYGPGHPLTFDLYVTSRSRDAVARDSVLVASAARVGAQVNLKSVEWRELSTVIDERTAPAFVISWIADLPDPDSFLYTLLASNGTYNMVNFRDPGVDSLLAAGRVARDPQVRLSIYRRAEEVALADAPLIPLFNVMTTYAFQPYVRGVEMSPFGICSVPFRKIWFTPREREAQYAGL